MRPRPSLTLEIFWPFVLRSKTDMSRRAVLIVVPLKYQSLILSEAIEAEVQA